MKVAIAQCTDKKRDGTHLAKDLYSPSDLFNAQWRYAQAYADKTKILSGEYGLIRPWREIQSYDTHISEGVTEADNERMDLFFKSASQGKFIHAWDVPIPPKKVDGLEFILLCGEEYAKRVEWYLDHYDLEYTKPFAGLRYQERINAMIQEARKIENERLTKYA